MPCNRFQVWSKKYGEAAASACCAPAAQPLLLLSLLRFLLPNILLNDACSHKTERRVFLVIAASEAILNTLSITFPKLETLSSAPNPEDLPLKQFSMMTFLAEVLAGSYHDTGLAVPKQAEIA